MELLIATLVGSATLGAAVLITDQVSRGYTSQLDGALVQEEARFALTWIEEAFARGRQQSVQHRGVETAPRPEQPFSPFDETQNGKRRAG